MNFVTYFDKNYIPKALAMMRSLKMRNLDCKIFALCCDKESERAVNGFHKSSEIISLSTIEAEYSRLAEIRSTRSWVEYMWTLTPLVMLYLLEAVGLDEVAYVDADLYFFSSLSQLYAEADGHGVCAIPHRWSPEHAARLSPNGKYNVSWLRANNAANDCDFLDEWGDLCIDSCLRKTGNMGDQGYLDALAPRYGIYDIQHLGANLAPWSQSQYNYEMKDSQIYVEQDRLLFYHFHEFLHNRKGDTLRRTGYQLHPFVAEHVYPPYEAEIKNICRSI